MASSKSKSKSKSKSTKKKPPAKKKVPKPKKKNVPPTKAAAEKKNTKIPKPKADKKKSKAKNTNERATKNSKKNKNKVTKRKSDKLKGKPDEKEINYLPVQPVDEVEIKEEIEELPIIMECTESEEEEVQNNPLQDEFKHYEIPEIKTEEIDLSNIKYENDFDETNEDFKIDIDLSNELIDEELTLNLGCFVNLHQLALSNDGTNSFVQSISGELSDLKTNFEFQNNVGTSFDEYNKVEENKSSRDNTFKTLQSEEVINCICGYGEEDGLMVQCDVCLTWQHAFCCGMNSDNEVPENYLCAYCTQPINVRPTQRYSYAKHFLTLSKLPRFSKRTCQEEVFKRREAILTKTFEMTANLKTIAKMERTVTAKLSIAEEPDHPKLYMWSANWDSQDLTSYLDPTSSELILGPIGERPIESVDCRLRLLDKIEADQRDMSNRLSMIFDQLKQLESEDHDKKAEEINLKRVIKMLEKDLKTVAAAASIS